MTLPQKASTPLSGHSDAPRAHSGALRDLQASDWEVLLSDCPSIPIRNNKGRVNMEHHMQLGNLVGLVTSLKFV